MSNDTEISKKVLVSAEALRQVLQALNGPGHYIRELQVTRGSLFDNPIDKLIAEYNTTVNSEAKAFSFAAADVLAERQRQIEAEGWTPEHDDQHDAGELALAAACYAYNTADPDPEGYGRVPYGWPWVREWWKPTTTRRDLVKAGALILAEIERLDRVEAKKGGVV